ncbi:DUF3857 domain-containing protein [Flavobacterium sp.]|uniref:DUF3857 domain-containing protein n=1 Tax=Flavobacterium sp. TaxID=239 RepID=UPI003752DD80
MMKYKIFTPILLLFIGLINAQNKDYSLLLIPENLKENANSIIRNQLVDIEINSQKTLSIKTSKTITVLNSKGLSNVDAREYYSDSEKIISIQATVYNSFGKEIKKFRRSDFSDQSVADGFSILTDGRYLYLDYTPIEYPFTVVYESELKGSNTAFIPSWSPIDDYFESVQKSEFTIHFPSDLGFKYKELNFEARDIKKKELPNSISFSVENLVAEKPEELSPSPNKILPSVKFALEKFRLEGVEGTSKTWEDFGLWMYNSLLSSTEELSEETQKKAKELVGNESDDIKKAKIIYQYVQDKTRYVSIQLGIGGWKPMLAKDVDRLGYGDCKALSNYTRVLLKSVGVESFYTEIYGDTNKRDFQNDFVAMQGNHVILTLPNKGKYIFLECTNQSVPFGFQGDFTDDRFALMIKPTGGEIIKTNEYLEKASTQISKGNYAIDLDGNIKGNLLIKSKGIQYDNAFGIEKKSKDDIDDYYKAHFNWINNLKMDKIKFHNDKDNIEFTEELQISASSYGSNNGSVMMIPINVFNQSNTIPQRYRNRKNPMEISRGFYDEDEIEVLLPEGFKLDAKPDVTEIKDKFGVYKMEVVVISSNKLLYKRSLLISKGIYDKVEYENYRKFREQIARADNSKIVITKI